MRTHAILVSAIILGASGTALAQPAADFFKGKQLRLIVASDVGGGYDVYARVLARHIGRHIPGSPTIIVQNQPGAGGMIMTNQLYGQGGDGTVIGMPLNGVPTASLLSSAAKFDSAKLNWLGSLSREPFVGFVWHTAPITNITEIATKEVLVGATTPGATMVDYPLLLNDLLGYKFKIVRGYKAPPQINLAIERGEVQGNGGVGLSVVKTLTQNWIDEKKIRFLVQYNFQRHPELANVPLVTELAKSDIERQAMRLVFSRAEYARPFFLPPGVPADRVAALRRAFDATAKDPAFVAEMASLKLDLSPMTGEEMQTLVNDLAGTPAVVIDRVRSALSVPAAK